MESETISKNGASSKSRVHRCLLLRKLLLFGLMCMFCVGNLLSAKPLVNVKSGDVSVMKIPSVALLEINFSDAYVDGETMEEYQKKRGDKFVRDWNEEVALVHVFFQKIFNYKNKKGMLLTTDANDASYKMVINVTNLNMGDGWSSFAPFSGRAGGMLINGYIDIIDIDNNEAVCTLNFDGVKGSGQTSVRGRIQMVFLVLAKKVYKVK